MPLNGLTAFRMAFDGQPTAAGEVVSEHNALEISTVYACVRIIAESIATIPFRVYQTDGKARTEATTHTLSYLLGTEPNPDMSAATFFESLSGCLALTGNAYAEIERGTKGSVVAIWPLDPHHTEPARLNDGTLIYITRDGTKNGEERQLQAKDVIHLKLFSQGGLKGLSPIALARQELGLAQAQLKSGARFYGNGSKAGGILTPSSPLTPLQMQQTREFWEQQVAGVNQGRIGVLPADFKYTALGLSMEDAQWLQSRGYTRNQIAALFRLDPHWVGDTTRMSDANHEQSSLSLIQDTLAPYLTKFTQEFMRKLLPTTGRSRSVYDLRFDLSERLKTDLKTTIDSLAIGRQWGAYSANDMRQALGLNPIGSEGDIYLDPVNMMDARKFAEWSPIKPTPPAEPENK